MQRSINENIKEESYELLEKLILILKGENFFLDEDENENENENEDEFFENPRTERHFRKIFVESIRTGGAIDLSDWNIGEILSSEVFSILKNIIYNSQINGIDLSMNNLNNIFGRSDESDLLKIQILKQIMSFPFIRFIDISSNFFENLPEKKFDNFCKLIESAACKMLIYDYDRLSGNHSKIFEKSFLENFFVENLYSDSSDLSKFHGRTENNRILRYIVTNAEKLLAMYHDEFPDDFSDLMKMGVDFIKSQDENPHHALILKSNAILNNLNKLNKHQGISVHPDYIASLNASIDEFKIELDKERMADKMLELFFNISRDIFGEMIEDLSHARALLSQSSGTQAIYLRDKIQIYEDEINFMIGRISLSCNHMPDAFVFWNKLSDGNLDKRFDAFNYCYMFLRNNDNNKLDSFLSASNILLNNHGEIIFHSSRPDLQQFMDKIFLDTLGFASIDISLIQDDFSDDTRVDIIKYNLLASIAQAPQPTSADGLFFKKNGLQTFKEFVQLHDRIGIAWQEAINNSLFDNDYLPICEALLISRNQNKRKFEGGSDDEQSVTVKIAKK